jgi:methionyl-tRNA synthetase
MLPGLPLLMPPSRPASGRCDSRTLRRPELSLRSPRRRNRIGSRRSGLPLPSRSRSRFSRRSGCAPVEGCRSALVSLKAMRYYLTTPIYYVNSSPHIGHAYTTIAADALVRHHRQRGDETFFLTGTDENASKVYRVAEEQGLDPKTYVDEIVEQWRELPKRVGAEYDFFIRTTDEGHHRFVQDFLQRIYDNGDIYQDVYSGLYCVGCEEFKNEADLVDGLCPEHGTPPERIEETNYFFRLSAYQDRLLALYDEQADFVLPRFRYNEARSFIAGGLEDFSVSRAGQPWGVPIPWDPDQVTYVWVDALINYLSALTYALDSEDLRERFWPTAHHLLGKDILRFHCVYWPALLLAAGYEVPQQLFVHGWLLLDDKKISKSLGNVVDPLDLVEVYGVDAVRFWALRSVSFGQDGNASLEGLHERYERELANDLGNLVSRTTAMVVRYRVGRVAPGRRNDELAALLEQLRAKLVERFDNWDLTAGLEDIWELVRWLNRYVESSAPWQLAKDEAQANELDAVLYDLADGLRAVTVALSPYLPETAPAILEALGQPVDLALEGIAYGVTPETTGIAAAAPLFPRVDQPTAAA